MKPQAAEYDVIVAGAGPAGSTAASLLAQAGRRVLLLDRERFPRFRIGESLMPATWSTFRRLGLLERLRASPFPRKHSVQFFSKDGRSSVPFYFTDVCDDESSITWQVDRAEFDGMLVEHAAACGAEVVLGANVREPLERNSRVHGAVVELDGGERRELASRVLVDASGQTALLARRYGLRDTDAKLRHLSLFTRYRGAWRGTGRDEGATLILHTRRDGVWFWYIPLPGDEVSVGIVGPPEALEAGGDGKREAFFESEVAQCPPLRERLAGAEQTMPLEVLRDFSYISTRIAGDGWVIAGDAFGFLDPIYSTGVLLALKSAEFGADSILDALAADDVSAARLGAHGERFLAGMEALRQVVYAFYSPEFNFKRFLSRFPERREDLINLLIGNVFDRSPRPLLDAMAAMCELPAARRLSGSGA